MNRFCNFLFLKLFFLLSLISFITINVFGQNHYNMIYDVNYSSVCGAENLLTLHKATSVFEKKYLKTSFWDEKKCFPKLGGILYRAAKTILLDDVIDHLTILTQHEIFGHGGRYREFGYIDNSFHLSLVPPYGDGHGFAQTGQLKNPPRILSKCENVLRITGGDEANTVLSQHLISKWLLRGSVDYRETFLFLESFNNLSAYILFTKYDKTISTGNDIMAYITTMEYNENNGKKYTVDQLARQSLTGLINPFQFIAAFTYTVTYLFKGKDSLVLPMIRIKNIKYIPAFHYGFSPFGSEYYFDNYVVKNKKVYTAYISYGDTKYHNFWGFGLNALNLINYKNLLIGPELNVWEQPAFQLGGRKLTSVKAGYGGSFSSSFDWDFTRRSNFGISLRLGYKTAGFLAGENLANGIIFSGGLSFKE